MEFRELSIGEQIEIAKTIEKCYLELCVGATIHCKCLKAYDKRHRQLDCSNDNINKMLSVSIASLSERLDKNINN